MQHARSNVNHLSQLIFQSAHVNVQQLRAHIPKLQTHQAAYVLAHNLYYFLLERNAHLVCNMIK